MAKLILVRHGQSVWNAKNVFTGWVDVPLSEDGINEALKAGEKLADTNVDAIFTSVQIRAIQTAMTIMAKNKSGKTPTILHDEGKMAEWTTIYNDKLAADCIPVVRNWHLNERYYGELQGKNKAETAKQYGDEQVHIWRRSYDVPPPAGECLKDTAARTIPYFKETILPELDAGKTVLIAAHGNSLRSIVMHLENLTPEQVLELEIATGVPITFDVVDGKATRVSE